jgi:hypothetical protein
VGILGSDVELGRLATQFGLLDDLEDDSLGVDE